VALQEKAGVMDYLELQGNTDMLTKSELVHLVRSHGEQISDRNLTYYASIDLIPPAVRIGARGGAYPKIVADLVVWVLRCRRWGLSIEAIRELSALWRLIGRHIRSGCIDLPEFEYVARQLVQLPEANRAVPLVLNDLLQDLCPECRGKLTWILKGESPVSVPATDHMLLTFVLGEIDATTGDAVPVAWTQLRLPGISGPALDDPCTIILGVPNGINLQTPPGSKAVAAPKPRHPRQEEVLVLD
jgi:DNA-binding transcriptional MerR regulator